ncbi:MAG TPA: beta-ketoacyl synthase N-terminal-like domain-containing protein [Gemmataceae bacterium]|nr:beta-ketoacyl synthase N-terminal-like domain-containing protein [Gemmataceae bacterium]
MKPTDERVAIVGIGGLFPGAGDLQAFWTNVKDGRDGSSEPPPGRWPIPPEHILDPRGVAPDKVPTLRGYYLRRFTADLDGMDLADWPVDELDPVFHLALHIGNGAWQAAVAAPLDRARCGVILGNIALPTEKTNAITLEVLGPKLGLFHPTTRTNRLNMHSTGLPAALIARGLGFGLGGYALDAACASSLYAIKLARDELLAGRADAMIAGGLVRPDSLYTQMGFAQLRALSPSGRCSPFDARADGLLVGEGGCAFVLKRLTDAVAHGDTIHGVIAGIGLSNDIEGNVLQPAQEGQLRALRSAYRQAGWRPSDVQFIECHATGTPTGDSVEFGSLRKLWEGESGRAILGGVKSTVGHLLTGAGAASLAKVLIAMREKVLPPTANFERPNPKLSYESSPFRVLTHAEKWESKGPRRAAINGFGFGGINAHLLIEEWIGEPRASATGARFTPVATTPVSPEPIAVVGVASRSGSPIESLTLPATRFRIPPTELAEMLPQQTLMLQIAAEALDDTHSKPANGRTTGVYIGITLDPNTTNYHLRWLAGEINESLKDHVHPALTANRVMGSLASIAASRVARFLGAGGPSFAVCDENASGFRAVSLAVNALRNGEIDRALAGVVVFGSDPRVDRGGDEAAAVVLKRLSDAQSDGDRVYAVIGQIKPVPTETADYIRGNAAWSLRFFVSESKKVIRGLGQEELAFRIRDLDDGPYWFDQFDWNVGGIGLELEASDLSDRFKDSTSAATPLSNRLDGLFTLSSNTPAELLSELEHFTNLADKVPKRLARRWWQSRRGQPPGKLGLAFVAETQSELQQRIDEAREHLRNRPDTAIADRIFYSPDPLRGDIAFVYPGSGNHFAGMGRDLGAAFPHVLWRQMGENQLLASQYHASEVWNKESLDHLTPRELIFTQVALGTLVSDLLVSFGITPNAAIPYSLGESAMLYGTRAWRDRDEMFRRIQESPLFATDLAGPYNAARVKWGLSSNAPIDWLTGVINVPADRVRAAIKPTDRVYLQIINTADDCVIGGEPSAVESIVRAVGGSLVEVRGVSTAHCEVVEPVREAYRELHRLPTYSPAGVRYYSGAWGRAYELNEESAADAITSAALDTIDFPRVVNAAYADGARIFIEIGPGSSCTRMIDAILVDKPHMARAACVPRQDAVSVFLRLLANLHAEGVPVDLSILYDHPEPAEATIAGPTITLPVGYRPTPVVHKTEAMPEPEPIFVPAAIELAANPVVVLADTQTATLQAHEAFLKFATALQGHVAQTISWQTAILQDGGTYKVGVSEIAARPTDEIPRSLDFEQCMEFARGLVGNVFGPKYGATDAHPTRVRLPDGPLQLVDRVVTIEGEPLSLTSGRLVTDHLVHEGRWYLEHGRIPACISIEAGQADLMLSGFLGIDFKTRGQACYRLLDAAVTFHRELPKIGDQLQYDIRINQFFRQGDTYLFRFQFEGTVNGEPLLTMRDGCAGFFTAEELAAGKGIVHTALDLKPIAGNIPADWTPLVALRDESLVDAQVDALRIGDLAAAFGAEFGQLPLTNPMRLPGGMLKLVHRVERIEPTGGRYGLGRIRCDADIHPDDWFLTCHFVDDQVMPGTLMYECCLHSMRVLLMRKGWVSEDDEARFEPIPGIASRLKCRGQVIASTRKVTYEVSLKEIGFRPEPYAIGDALMYADGKAIVEVKDISLQMSGMTRERLQRIWSTPRRSVFTREQVLEFATGSPSKAFGNRYRLFDRERFIARLPGDPYSFIDRVTKFENGEAWRLAPGAMAEVQYEVPNDAWYFGANRCASMPYCVLNEIALQACGWMAAYCGAALTSPDDLHFRNLGGNAMQHAAVTPESGILVTTTKLTKVSPAAGMIILQFDFMVRGKGGPVYSGDTTFGFFAKSALANQVGLQGAKFLPRPDDNVWSGPISIEPPFPDAMLRMVDTVAWATNTGGPKGLGVIEGRAHVNPEAWFFKAHFFGDPVWPGSLGLESLVQLLKAFAHNRWGDPPNGWQALEPGSPHKWAYRGQIVPSATEVTIQAYITEVDDARRFLKADGLLGVDGRMIYQMTDFTLHG